MSIDPLLKPFKFYGFLFCLLLLSCTRIPNQTVVLKFGEISWTLQEVELYFQLRLKQFSSDGQKPENLKKRLINEIAFLSLVENWARQNHIQGKKAVLTERERKLFSKNMSLMKALKDHKNHLSLYGVLLKDFSQKTASPSLRDQKTFYNKNKTRFVDPASCQLRQILVKKEKLAWILHKRLKQGESFDQLSQLHSLQKNPGWVKRGSLSVFDQACFERDDSLSPVLKSPYGYHIFLVEKRKAARKKGFSSVQKQIIRELKKTKLKEQFQNWLKQEISKNPLWTNKKLLGKIHIQYKDSKI